MTSRARYIAGCRSSQFTCASAARDLRSLLAVCASVRAQIPPAKFSIRILLQSATSTEPFSSSPAIDNHREAGRDWSVPHRSRPPRPEVAKLCPRIVQRSWMETHRIVMLRTVGRCSIVTVVANARERNRPAPCRSMPILLRSGAAAA